MNTLLTGFGPFRDVVNNPTERLVRHFAKHGVPGHSLTTCVLPVAYVRAPALLIEVIERGDAEGCAFDLIWMLGVASASVNWRVERYGRNENAAAPDADDYWPPSRIDPAGPQILESSVPVDLLVSALSQAGLPAVPSESAGAYLCNHALYTALRHLQRTGRSIPAGFLHVPADSDTLLPGEAACAHFTFPQHIRAVQITLAALTSPSLSFRRPR